jgi:deazaflavin-dependent oxidoreductase (nitroreductase family)
VNVRAKDLVERLVTGVHRSVYSVSRGRIGGRGLGMPVVQLTTLGRRSGKRRRTMLAAPVTDGDRIVLVASHRGDDRHPAWFLNLRDHPDVELTMRGETRRMRARVASPDEKATLWPQIVEMCPDYGQYQRRTERDIPVVIVEPCA